MPSQPLTLPLDPYTVQMSGFRAISAQISKTNRTQYATREIRFFTVVAGSILIVFFWGPNPEAIIVSQTEREKKNSPALGRAASHFELPFGPEAQIVGRQQRSPISLH